MDIKIGKDSHIKMTNILKKIIVLDKKAHELILSIFRSAKENEFYKLKRQRLANVVLVFEKITYFSDLLKEF